MVALALQAVPTVATCRSVGLDPPRTWRFDKPGDAWQVTHWRGTTRQGEVRLVLPANTAVELSKNTVSITGRTSNGGIDVALAGTPARAQLDIYVSYELEVNVDTSLTPAIDALNTEGRLGVTCEIG